MAKSTIYIIHGWTYTVEPWTSTVSVLRSWGYEVKQLRVPGLTEPSDEVWGIDSYVDWLHQQLRGDKSPIIIGHSNGGRIALNYLNAYPNSFEQLILLNSAGINVSNQKISIKRRLFKIASVILRPLRYIPMVRKVVYRIIGGSDYERAPENMKQTLHNMLESDKMLRLKKVLIPTTILWGKKDTVTPIEQANKLNRLIKDSNLEVYDDWAHAPYITHPYELAVALRDALESEKVD